MKVLGIGTVVVRKGCKLLIIGYQLPNPGKKRNFGYFAVKYPRGEAGRESIGVLFPEEIEELCSEGYQTDEGRDYVSFLEILNESTKKIPEESWNKIMSKVMEGR